MPPGSSLFEAINDFAVNTPWLHWPMATYAKYGILLFAGYLLMGWWLSRDRDSRTMARALIVPAAAVVALGLQQLIVAAVGEERPYAMLPDTLVLITRTADPSFPSDHTCVAGAVAAGLFFVDRTLGWIATASAVLMAIARVYVGAHWPLDVIAGLAFGAAVTVLLVLLLTKPVEKLVRWARGNRLRFLLAPAVRTKV